jgi:hypothetical protein
MSTLYTPGRDQEAIRAIFGWPDTLAVKTNFAPYVELSLLPGWKVRLTGAWLHCWEEPVGADLVCDIQISQQESTVPRTSRTWSSVFGAEKPTVIAGLIQNKGVLTKFLGHPQPMELRNIWQPEAETKKILFRGDVTQVGSTSPGKGLVLTLEMQMFLDY